MALFDDSTTDRTERPTERHRRQARERGMVARSVEMLTAARLLAIWIIAACWFASFAALASDWLRSTFARAGQTVPSISMLSQLREQAWLCIATASWPLLIATSAIVLAHFVQVGWLWHWDNIIPQATRLSPLAGLQRLISAATIGRTLELLLKLTLVMVTSGMVLSESLAAVPSQSTTDFSGVLMSFGSTAVRLVSKVALVMLTYAALDYGWQRWRFERSLLMTREELREELKDLEGPLHLKGQVRSTVRQPTSDPRDTSHAEFDTSSLS